MKNLSEFIVYKNIMQFLIKDNNTSGVGFYYYTTHAQLSQIMCKYIVSLFTQQSKYIRKLHLDSPLFTIFSVFDKLYLKSSCVEIFRSGSV